MLASNVLFSTIDYSGLTEEDSSAGRMPAPVRFQLESQLVKVLLAALPGPLKGVASSDVVAIARELPVDTKVLDISLACFPGEILSRLTNTRGLLSLKLPEIGVLAELLERRRWSLDAISREKLSRASAFRELLLRCEQHGVTTQTKRGVISFTQWTEAMPPRLIAIEAKLARWEEALEQATYHAMHADYSYVALDHYSYAMNTKTIKEGFKAARIGLLTVSVHGELRVELACPKLKPEKHRNSYQKLRALRDIAGNRSSKYALTVT